MRKLCLNVDKNDTTSQRITDVGHRKKGRQGMGLTIEILARATGRDAAIGREQRLQPIGAPWDKNLPPTCSLGP